MDQKNLILELRRRVNALENQQNVFVDVEPKTLKTNMIYVRSDTWVTKYFDGKNWIIGWGGMLTDWNTTVIFTASDYRTIAWAVWVVSIGTRDSKTDYATTSGNFTMTQTTYFYWQEDNPTAIQTSTVAWDVVIAGWVLLAVGRMNPDTANKASLKAFGWPTVDQIIADEIVANSITANMIQANAITSAKLATTLLYAWAITLDTNGLIKWWQTAYDTWTGFFLGYSTSTYKLSIWNSAWNKLTWDGTTLSITGTLTATTWSIGWFDIGSDYIRDVANSFGLASTVSGSDDVRFWAGNTFANRATAPFRITEAWVITATSGTIGGTTIGSTTLTGGTIQTWTSGQRVVISWSVIESYDSSWVSRWKTNGSWFRLVDSTNTRNTDVIWWSAIGSLASMDIDGWLYTKAVVWKSGTGCNIYTYGWQITFQGYGGAGNGITLSSTADSTLVLSGDTITLWWLNLVKSGSDLYWNGTKLN